MKKKLNLFCILIFVMLMLDILSMSNVLISGFGSGMRHARENKGKVETDIYDFSIISLLPDEMSEANAQPMTDSNTGERRQVWPTQLIVQKDKPTGVMTAMFKLAYTLAFGVFSVAALVAFVCFVRNVNKNRIFIKKNVSMLRVMGLCLILAGVIATADGCYETYLTQIEFRLEGYTVDYGSAANFTGIIFGLFSSVMAEAFAIGLKMKEEQELTI